MSDPRASEKHTGRDLHLHDEATRCMESGSDAIKRTPVKGAEAKASAGPVKAAPKKPAKKVAKSWPAVNSLLTVLSLTATLGGWAHFTVQEIRLAQAEAAQRTANHAVVLPAPDTASSGLPPIPTVVPLNSFNTGSIVTDITSPPAVTPVAPVLRSVTAPPPPAVSAPAPVTTTRSSRR